jgi:hypothetical protein
VNGEGLGGCAPTIRQTVQAADDVGSGDPGRRSAVEPARVWTVDDHLRGKPDEFVSLFRQFEAAVRECGPVTLSPAKTTVTFKGHRRGFAGARPTTTGLRGYLDLMRKVTDDARIISSAPYTSRLYVHQFRLKSASDFDENFVALICEAYRVGRGDHLQ